MERTDTRSGGTRRLVLGFDAGCMTCSELAKRIEERIGDKVEVLSLNDPQMANWRKETLGEAAPWAPTLVEVSGGGIKAWTGARMGVRLSRALGPVATWRVMQVLGEGSVDLDLADSAAAKAVSGLTRGQFLKGIGGAAVAMSVLSGTGKLPSSAMAASSITQQEITGDALVEIARKMARSKDLVNVMGEAWSDKVQSGRVIEARVSKTEFKVIDAGNGHLSSANGRLSTSGDVVGIKAVKHSLPDGNSMLAVSYTMPSIGRFAAYYEYEKPVFLPRDTVKTKTEALLFRDAGDEFVLEKASSNRRSQILSEVGSSDRALRSLPCRNDRRCNSQCDVVYGYSRCMYLKKGTGCIAYNCRACAITCFAGPLFCGACAVIVCSWGVLRNCCRSGYGCKLCGICS